MACLRLKIPYGQFQNLHSLHAKGRPAKGNKRTYRWNRKKLRHQTLLGVTGSGKTFTIANVIANVNKPALVIAHNKTLAAQLYGEFKELFPENAVEFL